MIRRGDIVQYAARGIPGIPDQTGWTEVLAVFRQRQTALLRVWNGKILGDPGDHYSDVELPLDKLWLYRRRAKGRGKRGGRCKK